MSLPQNIQKSDSAIARSFSQELGLNLDFKTGRTIHWNTFEEMFELERILLLLDNGQKLITHNSGIIRIWSIPQLCLIKELDIQFYPKGAEKKDEQSFFVIKDELLALININNGIEWEIQIPSELGPYLIKYHSTTSVLSFYAKQELHFYKSLKHVKSLSINAFQDEISSISNMEFIDNGKILAVFFVTNSYKNICLYYISMDNFSIEKKLETAYFAHIGAINLPGYFYCSDRKNIYKYKPATNTKELVLGLKNLEHDQERISSNKNFVIAGSKTDKRRYVIKASSAKVIGWLDNSIPYMDPGFDNGTIIIGRLDGEMENKYFDLYYNNLASKQSIEINQHLFKLTNYHHHLKRFVFYNMVFDLEPEVFYHAENQHNETFREPVFGNIDNTEFITCLKTSQHGFSSAHFTSILSGNKQSVVPNPTITGIRLLEYLPEQKKWRIDTQEEIIIFNTDYGTEVSRCPIPMERGYADVSSCLKYGVNCKKGALYIFSLFTGDVLSKMNLYEGFEDMKRTQPKYSNAFFLQNTILVLYFDMVQSSEYLNIVETDYNLNIIREDKLQVEVAEPSGNTLGNMIVNKQKDKLLLEYNTNTYLIDIQDFSCKKIEITEEPSTLLEKQGKFSNDGKYAMIRKKENNYIYDVLKDEIRGRIPVDSSSRKDNYLFSPDTNLLIVGGKYYTTFYQLVPFLRIATMYIDSKEKFLIKTLPDQTSPNGWFYTNAPDKINVIKTKADGTEPELLPIDDEERQAFIKHHNRKDIVMNKLFKPGKYAEFAKLNASAEDFAKQDMAIELSKVEQKKLEDRT